MNNFNFECKKCGECCRKYQIFILEKDIIRWKEENRFDIIESIDEWRNIKGTGKGKCPWLVDNLCSIHSTKPMACRPFPTSELRAKIHKCKGSWTKED